MTDTGGTLGFTWDPGTLGSEVKSLSLSLSQCYQLRVGGIIWTDNGVEADPRPTYSPQFQLLTPDATAFGTWEDGAWESNPLSGTGPWAATLTVGAGQPASLNPGTVGLYYLHIRYHSTSDTPAFRLRRPIEFTTP